MSSPLAESLERIVRRVAAFVAEDEQIRDDLRQLGEALVALTGAAPATPAKPAPPKAPPPPPPPIHDIRRALEDNAGGYHEDASSDMPDDWEEPTFSEQDLYWIADRAQLKAEGARWARRRRELLEQDVDFKTEIQPHDHKIIEQAKELPDCFLWMNHPSGPAPDDLEMYDDLAGAFETLALAADMLRELLPEAEESGDLFEEALILAAEAQSTLRSMVQDIEGMPDNDQQKMHQWLKSAASEHQIYIQRYMRADDWADATNWPDVRDRIEALLEDFHARRQEDKLLDKLYKKIRYHATMIMKSPETDHTSDWERIAQAVDELVEHGVPPSNSELRNDVLPVIESLPETFKGSGNFDLMLREVDRFLASKPTASSAVHARELSQEVVEVATLLRGKSIVLIGGDCRPGAKEGLEKAFELNEVLWIETREHAPTDMFEPYVARPEVALVILAIRWSSHSYGDVKAYCDDYGKPLVRLPAGYNPNQVASQILRQCSDQLEPQA